MENKKNKIYGHGLLTKVSDEHTFNFYIGNQSIGSYIRDMIFEFEKNKEIYGDIIIEKYGPIRITLEKIDRVSDIKCGIPIKK